MSLDIKFNPIEKTYTPGEKVKGTVIVNSPNGVMKHNNLKIHVEGKVNLQLSARSIGLLEAFYSSLKPVILIDFELPLSNGGKCQKGITEYPFRFILKPINKAYEFI